MHDNPYRAEGGEPIQDDRWSLLRKLGVLLLDLTIAVGILAGVMAAVILAILGLAYLRG